MGEKRQRWVLLKGEPTMSYKGIVVTHGQCAFKLQEMDEDGDWQDAVGINGEMSMVWPDPEELEVALQRAL